MKSLEDVLPEACARLLAERIKMLRLEAGLKRTTLAQRAGVTEASLKRFERTGQASLELVLRTAFALGRLADFDHVLEPVAAKSMEELEKRLSGTTRKRGIK
jgi:transcriptional regulator with XRE-family HTH domain